MLEEIASLFVTESYPADRVVVREGTTGTRFYLLAHGQVSVQKNNPDGTQKTLGVLEDGDYFGEIALIKDVPRNATILTLTPCVMLSLHREIFQNLLERSPDLKEKFEEAITTRMNNH